MGLHTAAETFNPVVVDFYEQVGYLPEAIVNYLVLLGWSLDDKTEFLTRQQMIESFSLERVNPGPASFDPGQAGGVPAAVHEGAAAGARRPRGCCRSWNGRAGCRGAHRRPHPGAGGPDRGGAGRSSEGVRGHRCCRRASSSATRSTFDDKAFAKRLLAPGRGRAAGGVPRLAGRRGPAFDAATLERETQAYLTERGLGLGDIVHAVRVAVTGTAVGPGLFECLAIIGKDLCLRRIDRALDRARQAGPAVSA